jgi:hypothetical protein
MMSYNISSNNPLYIIGETKPSQYDVSKIFNNEHHRVRK